MWEPPDSGELRHQVVVLDQVFGSSIAGATVTYEPGNPPDVRWAKISPVRALDTIRAGQDVSQTPTEVTVRYRPGLTAGKRLRMAATGKELIVQGVQNMNLRNEWLVLTCVAIGENA